MSSQVSSVTGTRGSFGARPNTRRQASTAAGDVGPAGFDLNRDALAVVLGDQVHHPVTGHGMLEPDAKTLRFRVGGQTVNPIGMLEAGARQWAGVEAPALARAAAAARVLARVAEASHTRAESAAATSRQRGVIGLSSR